MITEKKKKEEEEASLLPSGKNIWDKPHINKYFSSQNPSISLFFVSPSSHL